MQKFKRVLAIGLSLILTAGLTVGCKSGQGKSKTGDGSGQAVTFPLSEPTTLTIWEGTNQQTIALQGKYSDLSDLPKYKELQKETNIKIKLITPTAGQEKDQFNLMVSSGALPDIFEKNTVGSYYTGGAQKAFDDGIIIKLNDLQKKYAPDLVKIYNKYPDVDALSKNDDGNYLYVPFIRGESWMAAYSGPVVRKDWLDKLNISAPETLDDWENMLTQFKTKMGASVPMLLSYGGTYGDGAFGNGMFLGAYGLTLNYYNDNGKVKYGSADPKFKDFLTLMAKWYKAGLIDPEMATNTQKTYDAKACSNKTGAFFTLAGGGIGKYHQQMESVDPNYKLAGVPYPVMQKGDFNRFYQTGNSVSPFGYISSKCKNPDIAMAYLNYGYTKKGYVEYNFGQEGVSYTLQNNVPTYTPLVTKNPDGLSMQAAIWEYGYASDSGSMVQAPDYQKQYYPYPEQMDAVKTWTAASSKVTPATSYLCQGRLTSSETASVASAETQISAYRDEQMLKFIEGVEPITDASFNAYTAQLKSLGLDNALKVRQTAEDRFRKNNPDFLKIKAFSNPADDLYK